MAAIGLHRFSIEPYYKNVQKSSLKLLGQLGPTFVGMVLRWSPFRVVSDDPVRQPRWPPSADIVSTLGSIGTPSLKLLSGMVLG